MKKRLLSAALALAMVLTMLPLAALPAFAADPTDVTWYKKGAALPSSNVKDEKADEVRAGDGGAWYSRTAVSGTKPVKYDYDQITSGVVNSANNSGSAKHFDDIDDAIGAGWTNIKLLNDQTISTTSFIKGTTIDLNGHTLGGTITVLAKYEKDGKDVNVSSVTITVKDSKYSGSGRNGTASGFSVMVGASDTPKASSTTITLQNVKTSGTVTAYYTTNCTVNVKGSETGSISLYGTSGGAVNVGDSNVTGKAASVSIETTGTSTGGKVTATNAEITSGVTLTGVGASLIGTNADVHDVTLLGSTDDDLTDSKKSSLAAPSVTLNGGTAGTITAGSGEVLTKAHGITLNGNAAVTEIEYGSNSANVTVNNSAGGDITVKNGEVKLNGSTTGPASAGEITLGDANSTASLTVTGSKVTTGDITASGGTVNVTVPNDDTNTFGTLGGNVKNRGISGGVWDSAVPAKNLSTSLVYQATSPTSGKPLYNKYVYYAQNQFQKLIDAYQPDHAVEITMVKDTGTGSAKTITFMDNDETLTVITYKAGNLPIALPTTVNGGAVTKWTEYEGGKVIRDLVNTAGYSTPATPVNRILNAQVTDNAITKLVGVSTSVPGLTVRLVGNTITLSGAIPQGTTDIKIEVTTDGKKPIEDAEIAIVYDNGSVRFANQTLTDTGMWITNDWAYLVMPNDTTRYSLNGSGLKVQSSGLPADQVHGYTGNVPVITSVTCSGTGWTNIRKNELAKVMTADATAYGSSLTLPSGSVVSFEDSPAVQEALNAVVAGISDSQVSSWLTNAQNTAWKKVHNTTPSANERGQTGYSEVHVVAYMAVNVSNYNTANDPGTLTMTLTPSYYVIVTGTGGAVVTGTYALDTGVSAQLNALRPVNGRALGSLTGEVGAIELTLKVEDAFKTGVTPVAHQNNTYAYPTTVGGKTLAFDITHDVNGSLGTIVVNGDAPLVTLKPSYSEVDETTFKYYDTLQAAVDDAEEDGYIDVDANYKGSCNISVTGEARKFQINTNGANRVTSNVAGVVTEKTSGTLYEVQLERSTNPETPTSATVSVGTANNGSATLNVTSAKPGATVSGTYKANSGYKAGTFTATAKTADGNKSVTVSVKTDGTFSFTVPSGATSVTVTPSFVQVQQETGLPYTDVAANAWFFDGVKYCYDTTRGGARLMQGMTTTTFGPAATFTRAQLVQILWNMKGQPEPKTTVNPYSDIRPIHYAYKAALWATENGYAEGYPGGTFRPDQGVTRQEMVVFLWRAAGSPGGYSAVNLNAYTDGSQVYDWAQNAMKWAVSLNILSGRSSVSLNGSIAPRSTAYRREVAVTVMNFDKLRVF